MSQQLDPSSLDSSQLYLVGVLCQLDEAEFDSVPYGCLGIRITERPYSLSVDSVDALIEGLANAGWIVAKTSEDGAEAFGLSDQARGLATGIASRLRERSEVLPQDDGSTLLCFDALCNPDGFERELIGRCLEEPPMALTGDEPSKIHDALMEADWIYALPRSEQEPLWFPSPFLWARSEEVLERVEAMQPRLRERLARTAADYLQLAPDSALRRALQLVDRANHADESMRLKAYRHAPIPIPKGGDECRTTTSSPSVCATIVKELDPRPGDRVLICGVKGGFTASLAAHVVGPKGRVLCLETDEAVANFARQALARDGHEPQHVEVRLVEDVTVGYELGGPWDAVVLNGNVPKIPYPIVEQMNDGGRLLVFLQNERESSQNAYLIRKNRDIVESKDCSSFVFTPIYGRHGWDDMQRLQEDYRKASDGRAQRSLLDDIDRKIAYPFTRSYFAASNSGEASETHTRVLKAYECLIKLLTIPLCSIRDASARSDSKGSDFVLRLLGKPALGHWMAALRQLSRECAGHPYADQLSLDLGRPSRRPRLLAAAQIAATVVHGRDFKGEQVTPLELLEAMIGYRNRSGEAHGSMASTRLTEHRGEVLLNALGELVLDFVVLQQWELYYVRSVELTRTGKKIDALRLVGGKERKVSDLRPPTNPDVEPVKSMVVLRHTQSGKWIDLHPWAVWGVGDRDQEELFLFAERDRDQARYITYHDSNRFPPQTDGEFAAIQSRHKVENSALVDLLDTVLEDARITTDEMKMLLRIALRERLADSEEGARARIIALAQQRLPGVIIDGENS